MEDLNRMTVHNEPGHNDAKISEPSKCDDLEDVLGFLRRPHLFEIKRGASEPLSQRKM